MGTSGKLYIDDTAIAFTSFNSHFDRIVRKHDGRVRSLVNGFWFDIAFSPDGMGDALLLEWITENRYDHRAIRFPYNYYALKQGRFVIYRGGMEEEILLTVKFWDACPYYYYHERFDATHGMQAYLGVTAAIIQYGKELPVRQFSWAESW